MNKMRLKQNDNLHVKKGTLLNASDEVKKRYIKFNKVMRDEQYSNPILLLRFEPTDHHTHRNSLDGLIAAQNAMLRELGQCQLSIKSSP